MFSESQARRVMEQVLEALRYLHDDRGILHGDLKPENILLADERLGLAGLHASRDKAQAKARPDLPAAMRRNPALFDVVKLCDFGHARRARDARYYDQTGDVGLVPFREMPGTQGYIAPEVHARRDYSTPIDMWAAGVLVFNMLGGYLPFRTPEKSMTEDVNMPSPQWDDISSAGKDFIRAALDRDPDRRLTAEAALAHPWLHPSVGDP